MMSNRNVCVVTRLALLFAVAVPLAATSRVAGAETPKSAVSSSQLPKRKQTTLGLSVTAAEACDRWKAAPEKVKVIDVRTPEEFEYGKKRNTAFVAQVTEIAQPEDVLLLTCRSGGRGVMAVNRLAAAGFTKAYTIVDGTEGDLVEDPQSVHFGKRMKNGWKNSAPWVYDIDPRTGPRTARACRGRLAGGAPRSRGTRAQRLDAAGSRRRGGARDRGVPASTGESDESAPAGPQQPGRARGYPAWEVTSRRPIHEAGGTKQTRGETAAREALGSRGRDRRVRPQPGQLSQPPPALDVPPGCSKRHLDPSSLLTTGRGVP